MSLSPHRLVVCGCGHWGQNLIRNFYKLGVLEAIVDPTPRALELAAKLAPGITLAPELDAPLLSRVNAVVIATPPSSHFSLCKKALEAGKDVYVEKPLALSETQGRELEQLADATGQILMVGHILEYHPAFRKLCDLVRSGALGELRYLYSNRLSLGIIRQEEDVLWSLAPHDVEAMLRLVDSLPLRVTANSQSFLRPGVADFATFTMEFAGGIGSHIFVSWLHPFKEQRLVVVGTTQMAAFDGVTGELTLYDSGAEVTPSDIRIRKGTAVAVEVSQEEPLLLECKAFIDSIESRARPRSDASWGVKVLTVLQAVHHSIDRDGQVVHIQPTAASHS